MRRLLVFAILMGGVRAGGSEAGRLAQVDASGVLRWRDDASEVALLGVNYYTPFTIDFAEIKRLNLDHKQVIRDDVAHFRRLGLGCVRIHCFERQFSDLEGNLLENVHVELLDFLIDECRRSGIYTVLTPIAWWGGGVWTDKTHGFSDVYPMRQMTTDRTAWAAQARFLKQFAEHVNRFTGKRFADDPCILAFECINEPLYPKDTPDSLVTEYINALADALRASGTAKPVYYNSWQGRNAAAGVARIDGVTCSSYPTGLCAGHALAGSQLGSVRGSSLQPDASIASKSRMAYEFDAADVAGSYMYPAMAKMFRSEGVQVAAQFQYDPLPLADVNQNWKTHHLNLVYTPGKALALAIAAEVFARIPRGAAYERVSEGFAFPPFRVSFDEDLSEMVTPQRYLASNTTRTPPPDPAALERVWGCGSSPVVEYGGSGAYFLDRVSAGVWRLQVYPDVFVSADPYTGDKEQKAHVIPGGHAMAVRLPDLGERFSVWPFDGPKSDKRLAVARSGAFDVAPGDYLLTRKSRSPHAEVRLLATDLAPRVVVPTAQPVTAPLVRGYIPPQWRAGVPLDVSADAACVTSLTVRLISRDGQACEESLLPAAQARAPYRYAGTLPGAALKAGVWGVSIRADGPFGRAEWPDENSFDGAWLPVAGAPVPLLQMPEKCPEAHKYGVDVAEVSLVPARPGAATNALRLAVAGIGDGKSSAGYTLPFTRPQEPLALARAGLRVVARGGDSGARVEIGFRMKDGRGLGCNLRVGKGWSETVVPVAELLPLWGLPSRDAFSWDQVERISVLTGAWLFNEVSAGPMTFELAALEWVPLAPALRLSVVDDATPWSLFDAKAWLRTADWSHELKRWLVTDDAGSPAVYLGVDRFDGDRDCASLHVPCDGKSVAKLWRTDGEGSVLHIRARAACPKTTAFELALMESGGVAWGTVVPLTAEWQTLRVPVGKLRLFTQWDKKMIEAAGPHLRLSRLEKVCVCFGRWLYPTAAGEPHAIEIAEIGVTAD